MKCWVMGMMFFVISGVFYNHHSVFFGSVSERPQVSWFTKDATATNCVACRWPELNWSEWKSFKWRPKYTGSYVMDNLVKFPTKGVRDCLYCKRSNYSVTLEERRVCQSDSVAPGDFVVDRKNNKVWIKAPKDQQLLSRRISSILAGTRPVSVLLFVLDSTSRPRMQMEMPKTLKAIRNTGGAKVFSFTRFHAHGTGSTRNKIPLHTGKSYKKFTADGSDNTGLEGGLSSTYQNWSFLEAKASGFITAIVNQRVSIGGTFKPRKKVYDRKTFSLFEMARYFPGKYVADYFFPRIAIGPLVTDVLNASCTDERTDPRWSHCVGNDWDGLLALNWLTQLAKNFQGAPFFAHFCFWGSHDNLEIVMDQPISQWWDKNQAFLKDKVIFVMGDHGHAKGSYSATVTGHVETRWPVLELVMPTWLLESQPQFLEALEHNKHILSSPADIYETVMHLFKYTNPPSDPKWQGRTLLQKLSPCRTCFDAGVDEKDCICRDLKNSLTLSPTSPRSSQMADILEYLLAQQLLNQSVCRPVLKTQKIISVRESETKNDLQVHIVAEIETKRKNAMLLTVEFVIKNTTSADRRIDRKKASLSVISQISPFRRHVKRCRRPAEAAGVNLHICVCQ